MKLHSMRRSAAERKDDRSEFTVASGDSKAPAPEKDDVVVRLEHHHIQKLGLAGPLPHGTRVEFHGNGEVGDSGTHEGYSDAEPRHHMTIRISRAALEHDAEPQGDGLRGELAKNTEASEAKRKPGVKG